MSCLNLTCISRIDVQSGEYVAIVGDQSFYILRFDAGIVEAAIAAGANADPDGIDDAFDLLNEVSESVKTAVWVGDCFIYNNASWRLNYCVGGEVGGRWYYDSPYQPPYPKSCI